MSGCMCKLPSALGNTFVVKLLNNITKLRSPFCICIICTLSHGLQIQNSKKRSEFLLTFKLYHSTNLKKNANYFKFSKFIGPSLKYKFFLRTNALKFNLFRYQNTTGRLSNKRTFLFFSFFLQLCG